MQRFNIALLPLDATLQKSLCELAQAYFSDIQDDYILGEGALAHVTLCQFYASNAQEAVALYHAYDQRRPIELSIERFRSHDGGGSRSKKWWAELLIDKTPNLLERQRVCFECLSDRGIESLNRVATYSPHITLARLATKPLRVPSDSEVPQGRAFFEPALGASSETGVLMKVLAK